MKKAILATTLGLAGLMHGPVSAQSAMFGSFDVAIELTPTCEINNEDYLLTGSTGFAFASSLEMTYVSFQRTDSQSDMPFTVRCTTDLPYSLKITDAAGTGDGETDVIDGTLALNYKLNLSKLATHQSVSSNEITGEVGTGAATTYHVYGTIPSGQPGSCNATGGSTCNVTSSGRTIRVIW